MADGGDARNGVLQSVDVTRIILSCLFPRENKKDMTETWMRVRRVCKMWRDTGELDDVQKQATDINMQLTQCLFTSQTKF